MIKASIILVLISLNLNSCASIKNDQSALPAESYDLLNNFLKNAKYKLYNRTVERPEWAHLIEMDSIIDRFGMPFMVDDDSLRIILSHEDLKAIRSQIELSRSTKLDKDQLTSIELAKSKKKGVQISTPIILNDLAVLRFIGEETIPIYILRRQNGHWAIIYTFYQKLVLH